MSTIYLSINMTAVKIKEMIFKKLVRRTKDTLGAPKSSQVKSTVPVDSSAHTAY